MAVSPGFRIGTIVFLAALAAVLGVVLLGSPSSDADYRPPRVDQSRMVLRLPDLPPGYGNGYLGEGPRDDGLFCEAFSRSSDRPDPVARFARTYRARGCIAAYISRFTIPGQEPVAPVVFSGVMAFGSAAAAADAWDLVPTMLGRLLPGGHPPPVVEANVRIGAQTRLFHTVQFRYPFLIRGQQKTSFLAWRSGNTVAAIVAEGASFATDDRVVAELAPLQQAHIRKPTPYTAAERSDAEVGLDDPAIDIPVYWLGRTFRPGGGLPPNRLFQSGFGEPLPEEPVGMGSAEAPQSPLVVDYRNIWLDTWTPETWHLFADSATAKVITSWKCTQKRTVAILGGSATIFGGYKENYARCPKKPPSAFTAWVDVAGVKIVVNSPPAPDFIETVNPYGSFKGMKAIVAALKERPKRLF
jgi:hypothetical protein